MIDNRIKLNVLIDDNTVFSDVSNDAADFLRDSFALEMVSAEDTLYVGFYKPINAVYIDLGTANINAATLSLEAFNGTSWVSIDSKDETEGLTRSGFITWERDDMAQVNSSGIPQGETDVNGITGYWVRATVSTDMSASVVNGINLVFSDDAMLVTEFPSVLDPRILGNDSSQIRQHVSARNFIVQQLRNDGYIKYNSTTGKENFSQWDLLDVYEIREAATALALSNIFFILSDEVGDNWWTKHQTYNNRFKRSMQMANLSVDSDDDGIEDASEKLFQKKSQSFSR